MKLEEIRDAVAGGLANVPGLHVLARATQIHPPAAVIELDSIEYHDASMGEALYRLHVTVLVAMNDIEAAQRQLDAYVDPTGIRAALEADPTLDGAVGDVTVREVGGYQRYDEEGTSYLGARFTVEVR